MAKSRKSKGKAVELAVATTSLIDSSKGVGGGKAVSAGQTPALKPQEHGGALLAGGQLGNKGGGRTPDELRALMREPLAAAIPLVVKIIQAADTSNRDLLAAVGFLATYCIGTKQEVEHTGRVTLEADTGSLSE